MNSLFSGGTDRDLNGFANGNDLEYKVGEEITFSYKINPPYKACWALYKDDPEINAIAEFGEKGDNSHGCEGQIQVKPVKRGETEIGETELSVTTKMNQAGVVRFDITFKDEAGNTVKYDKGTRDAFVTTVAVVDMENIKQPIEKELGGGKPEGYISASGEKIVMNTDDFFNQMRENFGAQVNVIKDCIQKNSAEVKDFFLNSNVGDELKLEDKLYLLCSKTGDFRYITFRIATNSTVGVCSTGEDGLFSSPCYAKAQEKYGLPQYNLRPAAGVFAFPSDLSEVEIFSSFYQGYGNARAAYNNGLKNRFMVNMNSHGMRDELDDDYIANIAAHGILEGGNKLCIFSDYEAKLTDPHHLYMYGIIMRDYIAFQVGKAVFETVLGKKPPKITSNGGSMGGWQSFMVTALDFEINNSYGDVIWMATIGAETTNDYISNFLPRNNNPAFYYFSSVCAAQHINSTMKFRPQGYSIGLTGGLADHTSILNGILAIYNAFDACPKTISLKQFGEHGFDPVITEYVSKKADNQ